MQQAEFDQFADEYDAMHQRNIRVSGESPDYFARYKIADFARHCRTLDRVEAILDFGAGIGNSIPWFRQFLPGRTLTCADVSQKSLDRARLRFPRQDAAAEAFALIEDGGLPLKDDSQDAIFSACVFHHIPHEEHAHWLDELLRVARPGGALSIYEHNPLNPLTVHAVNTCEFDANAHLIRAGVFANRLAAAGWRDVGIRYHVFFPRKLSALRPLEPYLSAVPLGAQYAVYARKAG